MPENAMASSLYEPFQYKNLYPIVVSVIIVMADFK